MVRVEATNHVNLVMVVPKRIKLIVLSVVVVADQQLLVQHVEFHQYQVVLLSRRPLPQLQHLCRAMDRVRSPQAVNTVVESRPKELISKKSVMN